MLRRTIVSETCRSRLERAKRELVQCGYLLDTIARNLDFGTRWQIYAVFCRELVVILREYRKRPDAIP